MFPALYQAHHNLHHDDLTFWLDLADRYGDPILELGCGTGRVTLPLASAGHQLFGVDNDPGMLSYLRENLSPNLTSRVLFWQGDITAFQIALKFPLVIMPCNTFSTLSGVEREATLVRIAEHLDRGGTFAASLPNPSPLNQLPDQSEPVLEESFLHPMDGEPVQVSCGWDRIGDQLTFTWHYDHLLPDGTVERTSRQVRHHLISSEKIIAELGVAGLKVSECFGDFQVSPYSGDGPYFIFLATLD